MTQADKERLGKNKIANIHEYLDRLYLRRYAPMKVYPDGKLMVQVNGKWITNDTFQKQCPPINILFKVRENPYRRGNFINDKTCLK